jgi:hypothetical protein
MWLKRENNWAALDPDKWALVLQWYIHVSQLYLELYILVLQLIKPQRQVDGGPIVDNPDMRVAQVALEYFAEKEAQFIEEIAPIAVSKAMAYHGHRGGMWASKQWQGNPNWPTGPGAGYVKLRAGPGQRLWMLNSNREIWGVDVRGGGSFDAFGQPIGYALANQKKDVFEGWIDFSVVARDDKVTEIHALQKVQTIPPLVHFFTWDHTVSAADNWQKFGTARKRRYGDAGPPPPTGVQFTRVAASPNGFLYLLDSNMGLWFWNDKEIARVGQAPALSQFPGAQSLALSSSSTGIYMFGGQAIAFKRHEEIAKAARPWHWAPRPGVKLELPAQWAFSDVTEGEGMSLLAAIGPATNLEYAGFYSCVNGSWAKHSAGNVGGNSFGAFPLGCREEFYALAESALSLSDKLPPLTRSRSHPRQL